MSGPTPKAGGIPPFQSRGGTNGAWYDLFSTPNLSGGSLTNMPWAWLGHGPACDTIVLTNQPGSAAYYILGTPSDRDGDGLTDAYELLVSHTDPNLWEPGMEYPMAGRWHWA